jgi:putative pyruvate formate lyase activating enzyme
MWSSIYRDFERLWIWERLSNRLGWYLGVSINRYPAKYNIANRVAVPANSFDEIGSIEEGLSIYERATEDFLRLWRDVRYGGEDITRLERPRYSLLDLARSLVRAIVKKCVFCRWRCGVDRAKGDRLGACMLTTESRVGSYFHHFGEELVFRGTYGSGTIFFTSCNMRCLFCQNSDISRDRFNGVPYTPRELAQIAFLLRIEGCHNINWVGGEPTVHLHSIVEAMWYLANEGFKLMPRDGELEKLLLTKADSYIPYPMDKRFGSYKGLFNVPMLFNTNMFLSRESMILLRPLIDIWLPDFKFGPGRCAIRLSRTPWYYETVANNIKTLYEWGEEMVIRHLVMPNHVECCTKSVLEWIAKNIPGTPVNVMDQYRPEAYADPSSPSFSPDAFDIARRPTREEILRAWRYAEELGLNYREITFEKKLSIRSVEGLVETLIEH